MADGLVKMLIIAYSDSALTDEIDSVKVYINPEKYTRTYTICYNNSTAQGSSGGSPNFNKSLSDQLDFELVFDGTGVVPSSTPATSPKQSVTDQVDRFLNTVEKYDGQTHSPNFVRLAWGDLNFKCRMESFKITYTLFKPDGAPLRARANVAFVGYSDPKTLAKEANPSSPDLTHILTVNAGDTLPQMCYRVYGSSLYYPQVARVNSLTDFRNLAIGTQLVFPPLSGASE